MPREIDFSNPAFRGVQAQVGKMYAPTEGEFFVYGGSNESAADLNRGQFGNINYIKNGQVKTLNLESLGYKNSGAYDENMNLLKGRGSPFQTSGQARIAGLEYLKTQGFNPADARVYNGSDVQAYGGAMFKNMTEGSLDELKSIYGTTPQTGGNIGAQTNIQGVGAGAVSMDQAVANGTATNYDSTVTPQKQAELQAQDKATQAQAGTAPAYTQPTQTGQVQNPTYSSALVPTTPQTPLQQTISSQVESNPQALANNNFINGVFKAYHGRDANAQELARYASRTIGDSYKEIIGGAPTQQGTQDANLIAQGFDLIDNPAELEKLSAMAGFDPSKIVRVDARMYAPPKLNVGTDGVFGSSDVTDPVSSDLLKGAGKSDLNSDFLASTVNNYADQYNSQIPNSFTEIRDLFYKEVLNNKYRQELYAGLLEKSQIDELSAQLTSIDKQIASRKQAWDTLGADVANTPISITAIQGRNAHIANMKNIEIEGLLGQRNAIAGDYDRAQKQLDNAYKIAEADYSQKVEGMKLFYEDAKELFNKQEQRTYEAKIKAEEQKFELYKEDLKTKKDLMMKYPTAGITLNDSFDIAMGKAAPAYLTELSLKYQKENEPKIQFNPVTGESYIIQGGTVTPYDGYSGFSGGTSPSGEGSVSFRNNNPLNIKFGDFASKYGAVAGTQATDGGVFATFPTVEAGFQAAKDLLKSSSYANLPLEQAMRKWSGNGYGSDVAPSLANKTTSQMNDQELQTLISAMQQREGWTPGNQTQPQIQHSSIPLKIAENITTSKDYTTLQALEKFNSTLKSYRDFVKDKGYTVFGDDLAKAKNLQAQAYLDYKEAANLGALTGPDLSIMERALAPAFATYNENGEKVKGYLNYFWQGGQSGVIGSVNEAINTVARDAKSRIGSLQQTYSRWANDPMFTKFLPLTVPATAETSKQILSQYGIK